MADSGEPVVLLLGGGVESTALANELSAEGRIVTPVHVHCGLIWDECELSYTRRFCNSRASSRLLRLVEVSLPLTHFLSTHWSVTGQRIPRSGAPSAELEIPLRNLTLLAFALHAARQIANGNFDSHHGTTLPPIEIALGTTADNHYRDGSREYFDRCEAVLSLEAGRPVRILTPYIEYSKVDVIRRSDRETLALSFSCVNPQQGRHCGQCIKCGRRRQAFAESLVADPTVYAI